MLSEMSVDVEVIKCSQHGCWYLMLDTLVQAFLIYSQDIVTNNFKYGDSYSCTTNP